MNINFGCGKKVIQGYFNIDAVHNPAAPRAPELLYAARFDREGNLVERIPLEDGCADQLQAMHVIEHVFAWEALALIVEWKRLLKSGGRIVLELPNIMLAAKNLLAGQKDQMCMWPLYGDWNHKDPYMMHKHGYTPETIQQLLRDAGFHKICMCPPKTHGAKLNRDMRVEAVKP